MQRRVRRKQRWDSGGWGRIKLKSEKESEGGRQMSDRRTE